MWESLDWNPNLLFSWLCSLLDFSYLASAGPGQSLCGWAHGGKVFMAVMLRKGSLSSRPLPEVSIGGQKGNGSSSLIGLEAEGPRAGRRVLGLAAVPKPLNSQ